MRFATLFSFLFSPLHVFYFKKNYKQMLEMAEYLIGAYVTNNIKIQLFH